MKESDKLVVSPFLWFCTDQPKAFLLIVPDTGTEVADFECKVMYSLASLFEEFMNGGLFMTGLQQLNLYTANLKKGRLHILGVHLFDLVVVAAQEPGKEFVCLLQVPYRDPDVFQFIHNWVNFGIQRRNFSPDSKVLEEISERPGGESQRLMNPKS